MPSRNVSFDFLIELSNETDFKSILINDSCSVFTCPVLSSGVWFLLQSILLLLAALFSLPYNYIVVDVLRISSCVHPNVRVLLLNIGIANIVASLHYVGQSIYNFFFYIEIFVESDYNDWHVATQLQCALAQMLSGITVYALFFSMTGIVVERLAALTVYQASLSVDRESSAIGVRVLAVCCWLGGAALMLPTVFRSGTTKHCVCYCHSTLVASPELFYFSLVVSLLCELGSTVLCVIVRRLSVSILAHRGGAGGKTTPRRNGQTLSSLTERYQLNRNVNTMAMLYPSLISHCTFYILALTLRVPGFVWLSSFRGVLDDVGNNAYAGVAIHLLLLNMLFVVAACCLHPIIIVRKNAMLAKALSERWPAAGRVLFRVSTQMATVKAALSTTRTLNMQPKAAAQPKASGPNPQPKSDSQKASEKQNQRGSTWAVSAKEKGARGPRGKPAVTYTEPLVTEYRQAAGAQSMVWENFWKK